MTHQRVDDWGRVVLTEQGLLELFYKGLGQNPDLIAENTPEIAQYNVWCKTFDALEKKLQVHTPLDIDPELFHEERQREWLMPEEYTKIDVEEQLLTKCENQQQLDRVNMELSLFKKHDMMDVLRLFLYITDTLKANNVWWGVGRGSSVSSYCLYLLGVHKVDSLRYGLDIKEFIRDK